MKRGGRGEERGGKGGERGWQEENCKLVRMPMKSIFEWIRIVSEVMIRCSLLVFKSQLILYFVEILYYCVCFPYSMILHTPLFKIIPILPTLSVSCNNLIHTLIIKRISQWCMQFSWWCQLRNFLCEQTFLQRKNSGIKSFKMSPFQVNTKKSKLRSACNCPSIERVWGKGNPDYDGTLTVVVLGASGNLAMLKVSFRCCQIYT